MPESNELTSQSSTPRVTSITPGALFGEFCFLKWGGGVEIYLLGINHEELEELLLLLLL